jgi:hypothetical protein
MEGNAHGSIEILPRYLLGSSEKITTNMSGKLVVYAEIRNEHL